jgi:hypothetical protein
VRLICDKCGTPLAYVSPRTADVDCSTFVYQHAFDPSSDWVADWGDATLDGIAEITAEPIDDAVERYAVALAQGRKFDSVRWRVRCVGRGCRREYRGSTAALLAIVDEALADKRRAIRLSEAALGEAE